MCAMPSCSAQGLALSKKPASSRSQSCTKFLSKSLSFAVVRRLIDKQEFCMRSTFKHERDTVTPVNGDTFVKYYAVHILRIRLKMNVDKSTFFQGDR